MICVISLGHISKSNALTNCLPNSLLTPPHEIWRNIGRKIWRKFGGISANIPAEWVAGSAEWVAGSAVKLGIFSDFWRGASARAKSRKKCFTTIRRKSGVKFGLKFGVKFDVKFGVKFRVKSVWRNLLLEKTI